LRDWCPGGQHAGEIEIDPNAGKKTPTSWNLSLSTRPVKVQTAIKRLIDG
jgi:hypothetical protein